MVRHLKKDVQHHENQQRTNKTKIQELFEQLSKKEIELKNSEKELDNLRNDIKKQELRFDKQKQRTELFQNNFNESQLKV